MWWGLVFFNMTKQKSKPTKEQRKKFRRGFWWGRREHNLEKYTTWLLLLGFMLLVTGLLTKRWVWQFIAAPVFGLALVFRVLAGFAHRMEKHFMDKLRFGKWKKKK